MSIYKEDLPENWHRRCIHCNGPITKYSSCECGITAEDILNEEMDFPKPDAYIDELDERDYYDIEYDN